VTPYTKEIFIDVTGTDRKAINYALNIVVTALAERGSHIFSTTVHEDKNTYSSPDLNPTKKSLSVGYVNKILGTKLKEKEIIDCLGKMGYNCFALGKGEIDVEVPAWRSDILHGIDLVEDVAVGYGFDKFETDFPKALTFGRALPHHDLFNSLRSVMIGLGYNEVTTFTISNEKDEFTNMGLEQAKMVQIENPIGEEYSGLRTSLLPSLLKILRENKHHQLPQQLFEVGIVVDEHAHNCYNFAGIKIDAKANFTESKSIVEAVLRDIGVNYSIREGNHPAFIKGRYGFIIKNERKIGGFGELHPQVIQTFELEHPIIAFELKTDLLYQVL
ncbi:MAG: phenylalanine--tRNA ligase subunit beta, partial [Petrotogales bacterium]